MRHSIWYRIGRTVYRGQLSSCSIETDIIKLVRFDVERENGVRIVGNYTRLMVIKFYECGVSEPIDYARIAWIRVNNQPFKIRKKTVGVGYSIRPELHQGEQFQSE